MDLPPKLAANLPLAAMLSSLFFLIFALRMRAHGRKSATNYFAAALMNLALDREELKTQGVQAVDQFLIRPSKFLSFVALVLLLFAIPGAVRSAHYDLAEVREVALLGFFFSLLWFYLLYFPVFVWCDILREESLVKLIAQLSAEERAIVAQNLNVIKVAQENHQLIIVDGKTISPNFSVGDRVTNALSD